VIVLTGTGHMSDSCAHVFRADMSIANYIAAFTRAYPQKKCEVKFSHKRNGEEHFHVFVDGDRGDGGLTLTHSDLREATAQFLKGM